MLGALDRQLAGRDWLVDACSIADIAIAAWIVTMRDFYQAGGLVDLDSHKSVVGFVARFLARPAVK